MSDVDDFLMGDEDGGAPIRRIKIEHKDGIFTEVTSGNSLGSAIVGVPLILLKTRTLWAPERGQAPACKSPNGVYGFPGANFGDVYSEHKSLLDFAVPRVEAPSATFPDGFDSGSAPTMVCETCPLAQWTKGPTGKSVPAPCKLGYSLALLTSDAPEVVTLLELSGSGIRAVEDHVKPLSRAKSPLFVAAWNVRLNLMSRQGVTYSVPEIRNDGATAANFYPVYAQWARWVRGHLLEVFRPPSREVRTKSSGFDGIL